LVRRNIEELKIKLNEIENEFIKEKSNLDENVEINKRRIESKKIEINNKTDMINELKKESKILLNEIQNKDITIEYLESELKNMPQNVRTRQE
jgi:predicted RNase H-like nuclease (RuvC/YqgF family)